MRQQNKQATHTPTPWEVSEETAIWTADGDTYLGGTTKGDCGHDKNKANADFIVRAVNSHEELLSIVKRLSSAYPSNEGLGGHAPVNALIALAHEARAAIAKAEGKE